MIKTRLMMMHHDSGSSRIYKNGFHCGYKVVCKEGSMVLYKGLDKKISFLKNI
ncbi:unnamed protein product [Brassica rapa subsp. trilocularis]